MTIFRSVRWLLVSLAPVVLASCVVESTQPLSNEETSTLDKRLIGTWEREPDSNGNHGSFVIGRKKGTANSLEFAGTGLDKDLHVENIRLTMYARPGKTNYLSVEFPAKEEGSHDKRYIIMKYHVVNDATLHFHYLLHEVFRDAVRKGGLKGTIKPVDWRLFSGTKDTEPEVNIGQVALSDTPENILRYLDENGDKCFVEEVAVFRKVRPKAER